MSNHLGGLEARIEGPLGIFEITLKGELRGPCAKIKIQAAVI